VRLIVASSKNHQPPQDIQPEINVENYFKASICIGAMAACALLSGIVQAEEVTVKMSVSTAGLDTGQPAGARALYDRIRSAANVLCGSGNRVGLRAVDDFTGCVEKAVGDAVRSAGLPQLSLAYLATHSLQDAANHGIDVPALVAAK
jgi:UrcA family protein